MDENALRMEIRKLKQEIARLKVEPRYQSRLSLSELEMINSRETNLKYQALGTLNYE